MDPDVLHNIREKKQIPVDFYNKSGQIIIPRSDVASESQIQGLLKFVKQGLYYRKEDTERLGIGSSDVPDGMSDSKLLGKDTAEALKRDVSQLFFDLKRASFTSIHAKKSHDRLSRLYSDFEKHPNAMNGLVNIIELLSGSDTALEVELAMKRTVVAMAMKTRGTMIQNRTDEDAVLQEINDLMTGALLADLSYGRMKIPSHGDITEDEMNYVRTHPLMSYLLVAHEPSLSSGAKRNILIHHRPLRKGKNSNNYPSLQFMIKKLNELRLKHTSNGKEDKIAQDIEIQIRNLAKDITYDEDAAILAVASEFASLTSKVGWRNAFPPIQAIRMIINNSYFTYPERIINDLLNHIAISLCNNKFILGIGDYVIVAAQGYRSDKPHFEICRIVKADRFQSRPEVQRIGIAVPLVKTSPRRSIAGIKPGSFKTDPRKAIYTMSTDDTRRIIYIFDPLIDREAVEILEQEAEIAIIGKKRHSS